MKGANSLTPFSKASVVPHIGEQAALRFSGVRVGIAGAGGLGSNAAMMLVRSGFVRFVISDMDYVSASNLNRQTFLSADLGFPKVDRLKQQMLAVNPDACIEAVKMHLDAGKAANLFAGCDAVIEALDDPAAKQMLVETLLPMGLFVVAASGMGGWGGSDAIRIRRISDRFYVVGDFETPCDERCPPMGPRVMISAAKQVDVLLEHLLDK